MLCKQVFRIVDGWTSDYRYVIYSFGIDHINLVTVEITLTIISL